MDCLANTKFSDDHQPKSRPKFLSALLSIVLPFFQILLWLPLSISCLPFFLVGLCVWGLPPTIPFWSRIFRYFTAVFTEGKPEDNIPLTNRAIIFVSVLNVVAKIPVNGVCWFLDELLYPDYQKMDIKEPVFFLTAPRSGSIQLCQYLEEDKENFIIPKAAEAVMPYIWYWKLFVPALAKFRIKKQRSEVLSAIGAEARKRTTVNFSKAGLWDALVGMWHINVFSWYLGSSLMKWSYSYAKLEEPMDEKFYGSLLLFTNHVVKKLFIYVGNPSSACY